MLERVAAAIERHGMFPRGARVGVAVSGGADSVCLLHVLRELAPRWDLQLSVLHVNHRLRGMESDGDEAFVRDLCAHLGLEIRCHSGEVPEDDNLEQAARRIRQEFFFGLLKSDALDRVAVGHTRSDQAETVLFRLLRGAGTAGLAGIRPVTREGLVRPLIEVERTEVLEYLRDKGISWREDSSNRDRRFARNRIRHDLLPALTRDWNPALSQILAGVADVARDEEAYWRWAVDRLAKENFRHRGQAVLFRADWFQSLHPALARRVVRRAAEETKGDLRRLDLRHIEQIVALARQNRGSGRAMAPGLDAFRSFDWMRLAPAAEPEARDYEIEVSGPGSYPIPGTDLTVVIEAQLSDGVCGYNKKESEQLDRGETPGPFRLRNWRPGDTYRPLGHSREVRIKSLFEEARVPVWDRRKWPVLATGERILWAAQFGPAEEARAATGDGTILQLREFPEMSEYCNLALVRRRLSSRGSVSHTGRGGL